MCIMMAIYREFITAFIRFLGGGSRKDHARAHLWVQIWALVDRFRQDDLAPFALDIGSCRR